MIFINRYTELPMEELSRLFKRTICFLRTVPCTSYFLPWGFEACLLDFYRKVTALEEYGVCRSKLKKAFFLFGLL